MGFWNAFFGGKELSPEEEKQEQEAKKYDLLKYDGVKAMKTGQLDYAVRCFEEALKMKNDLEVRDYLSQVLTAKGDLDGALAELGRMAQAEPANLSIWLRTAQVAYMAEDYDRMDEACRQALDIDGNSAEACYHSAKARAGRKDLVGAIAMLTKAIALNADYADAYLMRGQALLAMGDAAGADQDADWLIAHVGDHEEVLMLKARITAAKGLAEEAIAIYDKVIDANPFVIEAFRERGQLKFNSGDKKGAEADMQQVLELDPQQLANVNGEYSAEGIEQHVKQAYSAVNPLGL